MIYSKLENVLHSPNNSRAGQSTLSAVLRVVLYYPDFLQAQYFQGCNPAFRLRALPTVSFRLRKPYDCWVLHRGQVHSLPLYTILHHSSKGRPLHTLRRLITPSACKISSRMVQVENLFRAQFFFLKAP